MEPIWVLSSGYLGYIVSVRPSGVWGTRISGSVDVASWGEGGSLRFGPWVEDMGVSEN